MGNEFQLNYYQLMAKIVSNLSSLQAILQEQTYNHEAFGSWWFMFTKQGQKYRVVFDGRDRFLRIEEPLLDKNYKRIVDWNSLGAIQSLSDESIGEDVVLLIKQYSK